MTHDHEHIEVIEYRFNKLPVGVEVGDIIGHKVTNEHMKVLSINKSDNSMRVTPATAEDEKNV